MRNERQDGVLAVLGYFNDDLTDFIKTSDYGITFDIGTNLKKELIDNRIKK